MKTLLIVFIIQQSAKSQQCGYSSTHCSSISQLEVKFQSEKVSQRADVPHPREGQKSHPPPYVKGCSPCQVTAICRGAAILVSLSENNTCSGFICDFTHEGWPKPPLCLHVKPHCHPFTIHGRGGSKSFTSKAGPCEHTDLIVDAKTTV